MLILTIRTEKPEASVSLFEDAKELQHHEWYAHRELSKTLHQVIMSVLQQSDNGLGDIGGIVIFQGPGSFTGLRIGITVANALAESLKVPVVGTGGDDWPKEGIAALISGQDDKIVLPDYGSAPHITVQKK